MAEITAVKALNNYFNQGEGKVPLSQFAAEVRALSPDEKRELATLAAQAMGDTLKADA